MLAVSSINLKPNTNNYLAKNQSCQVAKIHSQPIEDTVSFGRKEEIPQELLRFLKKFETVVKDLGNVQVRENGNYFVAESSDSKAYAKVGKYMTKIAKDRIRIIKHSPPKDIEGLAKKLIAHQEKYPYIVINYGTNKVSFVPKGSKLAESYIEGNHKHDELRRNPALYEYLTSGGIQKEGIKINHNNSEYLVKPAFSDNCLITLEAEKIKP